MIFNQVLDTTFKDTTTLPMELLKGLLKHGMKKKAQEGSLLSEQPFCDDCARISLAGTLDS
jgi:hypothetical protein